MIAAIMSTRSLPRQVAGGPDSARDSPKHVCLLIGQLGLGGAEKQVTLLALGLHKRGIKTSVLVLFDGGHHERALREAGVPVIRLGGPHRPSGRQQLHGVGGGTKWLRAAVRVMPQLAMAAFDHSSRWLALVRVLRRERPDVLHAFLFYSYVVAAPAAVVARVPVLVAGRRSLSGRMRENPVALALSRIATRRADLVIANARAVAEDARRVECIPASKIVTVNNGITASAFDPIPAAPVESEGPVILCVANLIGYKGHRYLLRAAALLGERFIRCTVVLAGDGPERGRLEKLACDLGVDARFLGQRGDVPALLARADVAVLPSLTEGMSNAVMEAMAAGKPVVATDVGGNRELLEGRGVLVPPADAQALADALASVLTDHEFAARIGAEALGWSRKSLHVDAMVEKHISLYTQQLELRCAA
jgi:glycosyltransferase involved in cell wall biosynthesis